MALFPCDRCGSKGPAVVSEALRNVNPQSPRCPACETPVDANGKSLEALMSVKQ